MSIRTEATSALSIAEADAAADEAAARDSLRAAAIESLRTVLATSDGTLAVALSTLTIELTDLKERLVIVTDPASAPSVSLGVSDKDQTTVHLVAMIDGGWTKLSGPLTSLADVGQSLATREA